jgi:hypothetical protein
MPQSHPSPLSSSIPRKTLQRIRTYLNKVIKPRRHQRAQNRPQPVDPVVPSKMRARHARPKGARGVDAAARVVYACELDDEQGEADADGRDEGVFGLFGGEHQDCEH